MTATIKTTEQPERAACLCGCGGFPSKPTSRYLPGHDAKHHSALKRAAKEQDESKRKARRPGKATA
jgi:hypothetical protein